MALNYFLSPDEAELTPCSTTDGEIFFPIGEKYPHYDKAIAICMGCDFTQRCADYATDNNLIGIWGGTTGVQRGRSHEHP